MASEHETAADYERIMREHRCRVEVPDLRRGGLLVRIYPQEDGSFIAVTQRGAGFSRVHPPMTASELFGALRLEASPVLVVLR